MKRIITLLFFTLLFHAGFAQWANLDSLPQPRASAVSFSIGDTGYVVSGGGNFGYWNNVWKYNKATNTWTELAALPTVNQEDNGVVGFAIGDTGYAGLGAGPGYQNTNSFWKYDTRQNQWISIASFPGVVRQSGVAFSVNGKGYVGGGFNTYYIPEKDFYAYDPSTGQWTAIADCPALGVGVNALAFAVNGKGYVGTGGNFSSGSTTWVPQSDFWAYDPTTDSWAAVASMPCGPRMAGVGFAIGNKGYVGVGVADANQSIYLRDFWQFDPANGPLGKWSRIEDYAGGGRESATSFVIGNEGYVCAGFPGTQNVTGSGMWKYTPDGVFVNPGTTLDIEPKSFQVCKGELVALTVIGGAGQGTNLVWSPSAGLDKPTGDTVLATITNDIVYTVNSGGSCATASGTDTIKVKSSNPLSFTPSRPSACPGQSVTISVSGGSGFTWNPSTGVQPGGDSLIATMPPAVDSVLYIVTGKDLSNCTVTDSVEFISGGNATAGIVTAIRDTICQNTSGNLTLINNSSNTIQWQSSIDNSNFTNDLHDTLINYKTTPLQQTTWYRVIVGSGNCTATTDAKELYVPLPLTANFNYTQSTATQLSFNSDSSGGNIRSYHWDFGDGSTSEEQNPSHTYAKDSTYYVCLTLYDGSNCSYTFCRYSLVTGIPTVAAMSNWVVYPDPFTNELSISAKNGGNHIQSVEMYDVLGQLVVNKIPGNSTNTSLQLDVSLLAKGMYYVMIRTATADYVQKVVKQ